MILIAHRGNTTGPNPKEENSPKYITKALDNGFDVEVDVWYIDKRWWLGHDEPQYEVGFDFIKTTGLWLHCKHYAALEDLLHSNLHFFYHTNEDYVLTSRHIVWAYPGKEGGFNTICVMPELGNTSTEGFAGVCSDYIGKYK